MRHLAELDNPDCGVDDAEKSTKQEDIWARGQISCGKERRENPGTEQYQRKLRAS